MNQKISKFGSDKHSAFKWINTQIVNSGSPFFALGKFVYSNFIRSPVKIFAKIILLHPYNDNSIEVYDLKCPRLRIHFILNKYSYYIS